MADTGKPWEKYKPVTASADTASSTQEPASAAVAPPSSADQATAKNNEEFSAGKEKMKADYDAKNKANSMTGMSDVKFGDFETQIPTFFTTPVGYVTAGAAAYGAVTGAKKAGEAAWDTTKKVFGSLRDFSKEKFGDDGLLANQQAEKAIQQANMTAKEATATQAPTTETPLDTKVKPLNPVEGKIVEQGVANTELKAAGQQLKTAEKEFAAGAAKGLPPPALTTGSGMPAHQGLAPESARISKNFASLDKVPKDMVFVPEGQYMDIVRNAVGQEPYTANLKATGGYPVSPEAAYKQSREINKSLGRLARDEAIEKGASLGDVTKSITKKIGGSKAVKVAGVGGALISLADLANAKTTTETALRGADLITDYLPLVGQVKQAFTPSEAGMSKQEEESIIAKKFKEAQKLGSPYRSVPPPR